MKTVIDNNEVKLKGAYNNLEDVLQEVSESQASDNRVVWSVRVNGKAYSEQSPHDAACVKVRDIKTLEIGTMDDTEICESFMQNGEAIADCLCKGTAKVSELFRRENEWEANRHYSNLLESCQGFLAMLHHSEGVLNRDQESAVPQGRTLQERLTSIEALLDSMCVAQENEDWISLADLLEYELCPLLAECKEIVAAAA